MNKLLPIFAVLATTAAIALYFWTTGADEPQPDIAVTPPAGTEPQISAPAVPAIANAEDAALEAEDLTPERFAAAKEEEDIGYDPMLVMALGDFTDEQIDVYNAHHIIPFNPAIGRDCEERPDPYLQDQSYTSCKTVRESLAHPYNDLDQQALIDLAAMDAAAALILGRRTTDETERLKWYLRATALSEKSGPLLALAERRYSSPFEIKTVDDVVAQVPKPDILIKRIALETVAAKLGDPRAKPDKWIEVLKTLEGGAHTQKALHQADKTARDYIKTMADIQRETTGSVSMGGLLDV